MDKKYIMVSMDDKRAKELGNVISNDTSRKILDFLGEHDKINAQQIAEKLGLSISTVVYNLKHLKNQGLVKVVDFAWSDKGKKVDLYSLANKIVIIAPKGYDFRETLKKIIPIGLIGGAIALGLKLWDYFGSIKTMAIGNSDLLVQEAGDRVVEESLEVAAEVATNNLGQGVSAIGAWWWVLWATITVIVVFVLIEYWKSKK